MKKTNFLKGLGAKLALAVVAFGAVMASCTEEDLNINVKPSNAMIYFNPSVIDPISVATVNATLTGTESIEGTPDIAAGSRTITANVTGGASGSTTVNYGEVKAGSSVSYSPIIILSDGLFSYVETDSKIVSTITKEGNVEGGHSHNGSVWYTNYSDYSAKFTAEWNETAKTSIKNVEIYNQKAASYVEGLANQAVENKGSNSCEVSAWGMVKSVYSISTSETTYDVISTIDGTVVAKVTVVNPLADVKVNFVETSIPGHENHYHYGHSHGSSDNAGGGMGWAE